jgi:DnaJ-class molecular chaperone
MDRDQALKYLNLTENANPDEIKTAYLGLSKKYHPDKNADGIAHEAFILVKKAYDTLTGQSQPQPKPKAQPQPQHDTMREEYRKSILQKLKLNDQYKNVLLAKIQLIGQQNGIPLTKSSPQTHKPIKMTKQDLMIKIHKLPKYAELKTLSYQSLSDQCKNKQLPVVDKKNTLLSHEELIIELLIVDK